MNAANRQSTRWLTLIGTIITQFALGSVYTWSLFNSSLSDKLGEPVSQVAFSFGLLSLGLALSSSVAGKLQERFGVKRVTMASGILLGLGFFLTAHSSSLMMLWLSAGVLVGLADGAGYLLTLSNCVKWFPERKGLISAFSIGSYGLGSLGFKFIDSHLLATVGLEKTFVIWGAIVLVMIVFGATLMKDAPNHPAATAANGVVENDFTLAESMRKPQLLDAGGDVPDGLHERSVRNWRSERYCPGNGPPGCRHGGQRGNGYLDCEPQRSPGVRYPV